jgi:dihydroorotate dehydrogenase (fumarate)
VSDLSTSYLGLRLKNPLVASASPMNQDIGVLRRLEDAGIAAVVLPSLFEEQIRKEEERLDQLLRAGAGVSEVSGSYFPAPMHEAGRADAYLELVRSARAAVDIPVIASLNGSTDSGWIRFARLFEQAGASAVELNLYHVPLDIGSSARQVERRHTTIVRQVREATGLPLAVKLNPYYSAFGEMALSLQEAGADGLVLFNRLYHPDIDLTTLGPVHDLHLSQRHEMRLPMMWLAALRGRLELSLAGTTGVESSDDVVRYLLAGADAVMSTSALLRNGPEYAASLVLGLSRWMEARDYPSVDDIRGLLARGRGTGADEEARERQRYRAELDHFRPELRARDP